MKVEIKLIDPSLPLPAYQTEGAVAFDLYSRLDVEIPPKSLGMIKLNVIIKIPPGYVLLVPSRSSLPKKKGLFLANSIGIIDQDYCGDDDEIGFLAYNFTDNSVKVDKGERIAQALFVPVEKVELVQVDKMDEKSRGGYGSTG